MPKAVQDRTRTPIATPPTSRRHILAALSGAALAGGALVVVMPKEAPAIPIIKPGADAELIAMIARFDALQERIDSLHEGANANDDARDAAKKPFEDEQFALLGLICTTPTHTLEGFQARARSLLAWDDGEEWGHDDDPKGFWDERMAHAILRGLAGEVRV